LGAKLLDLQSGRQFVDRYELIGEIAAGGMATVFLARLTGFGGFQRLFAIKRLHPHLQGEREFVQMFLDEARLAAGIHHPNVVPILEVGASDSGYYLVMEYIEGETLARLLSGAAASKQRLPVAIVIRMLLDTLGGLHAAHELRDEHGELAGVVHRDVSPQNVLVGADGVARITDFGVARAASRLTATGVGQLKGKIAYMAPEQARGDEDLDRRADVFAAGVVLWESLAHRRLFKASSEAATLSRVLNEPMPHLHEVAPHISPAVCDVVMKALERNRDARMANCAQFADALEAAAAASGELGTAREVQSYVQTVLGENIRAQREAVRLWTQQADLQGGPAPLHTPTRSTTGGIERSQVSQFTQAQHKSGRGWAFLSALLLLGIAGFIGYHYLAIEPVSHHAGSPSAQSDLPVPEPGTQLALPPKVVDIPPEPAATSVAPSTPPDTQEKVDAPARRAPAQVTPSPDPAPSEPRSAPRTRSKPKGNPLLDSNPYR